MKKVLEKGHFKFSSQLNWINPYIFKSIWYTQLFNILWLLRTTWTLKSINVRSPKASFFNVEKGQRNGKNLNWVYFDYVELSQYLFCHSNISINYVNYFKQWKSLVCYWKFKLHRYSYLIRSWQNIVKHKCAILVLIWSLYLQRIKNKMFSEQIIFK